MNYYMAQGNEQRGPFTVEQLRGLGLRPETLIWCEGMAQWQPAQTVAELQPVIAGVSVSYATPVAYAAAPPFDTSVESKRVAAGICGILLGGFGVHKFVLGFTGAGLVLLLSSLLTCFIAYPLAHLIGIIEGIVYLTKSDAEFYQAYIVQHRKWF